MPAPKQAFIGKLQAFFQFSLLYADAGQVIPGRACRLRTPGRFEECVIRFRQLLQRFQREPQVEVRFPGIRVGVAPGLLADGRPEERNALLHPGIAQQEKPVGIVQPDIGRVPPQSFPVVIIRQEGSMPVLFQVLSRQV